MKNKCVLFFLFTAFYFSIASCSFALEDVGKLEPQTQLCQKIQVHIKHSITEKGTLYRSKLTGNIPKISIHHRGKGRGGGVGVWLRIIDIDNNGNHELIYLIDMTYPWHQKSKLYLIKNLPRREVESHINDDNQSFYYREKLRQHFEQSILWDARGDIESGELARLNINSVQTDHPKDPVIPLRYTLFKFEEKNYVLVDNVRTDEFFVIEFLSPGFKDRVVCDLGVVTNW